MPTEKFTPDMSTHDMAVIAYKALTPDHIRAFVYAYPTIFPCFDPVEAYLKHHFPTVNCDFGVEYAKFATQDGMVTELPLLPWHDLYMSWLVNEASEHIPGPGYFIYEGRYVTDKKGCLELLNRADRYLYGKPVKRVLEHLRVFIASRKRKVAANALG